MSNYAQTRQEVLHYIRARAPLILIETAERLRAERLLRELAAQEGVDLQYYTETRQVSRLTGGPACDTKGDPLAYMAKLFRSQRGAVFAYGDVQRIGEDNAFSRELLGVLYLACENRGTVILITADPVWPRIAQFGLLTRLDPPDRQERLAQVERFLHKNRCATDWDGEAVRQAATLLRGFTEQQIENVLASAAVSRGGLFRRDMAELTRQKSRLYAAIPCVQEVRLPPGEELAGLECLKEWLDGKRRVFFAEDDLLEARGLKPPRGVLLFGVPGCGKSSAARMIARNWELPLFRFDIGSVYDKWVGESEKKMRDALQFLDNVAPCVVWVDEIEKGLAASADGDDIGKRVLGQFLYWLQESARRVFLVATANNVEALPAELFRKGRFSEVFFLDLPGPEGRAAAIRRYAARALELELEPEALRRLAACSDGFSYADIEYAVTELAQEAIAGGPPPTPQALEERFARLIPFAKSSPETLEKIREWGRQRAVPAAPSAGGIV